MPTLPMRFWKISAVWLTIVFLQIPMAAAQTAAPTSNILTRVLMVKSQFGQGAIFSIDVDQREYWITAKHILTGAKHPPFGSVTSKSVNLSILSPDASQETWLPEDFSVIDPGKDIDIVVLAASIPLLQNPLPSLSAESEGVMMGGDCEFLGFPASIVGVWRARFSQEGPFYWMPFIKHCTVSGRFVEPLNFWVLDGINNPGFSGGPVVFGTGPAQKILGVVSGYYNEPADVIAVTSTMPVPPKKPGDSTQTAPSTKQSKPSKPAVPRKQVVNTNSGFMIAFDITYAVEAIKMNPIGPLRKAT